MSNIGLKHINLIVSEFEKLANQDLFFKIAYIKKMPNGKWTVFSRKGRPMGTYNTKSKAVKRLRNIEFFKHLNKKEASKDISYSSTMRELNKDSDKEKIEKFQKKYKKLFDQAFIDGNEDLDKILKETLEYLEDGKDIEKTAASVELGNPVLVGEYLANIIKFLFRRISSEKRQAAIEKMKNKVYFINEYDIAGKKTPSSAVYGQAITLLKHILISHDPTYIRNVLNNIVRSL